MELQKVLSERRSIRRYKNSSIPQNDIETIIQAAQEAPSWKNSQTARYHVVQTEKMVKKIKKEALPEFNAKNVADAPVLIVMSFVGSRSGFDKDKNPVNEVGEGWGFYDCGLATENLLLKATELGYGTLVMGIRDEVKLRELLNIPQDEIIVVVIGLGIQDIAPSKPERKPLLDVLKWH